MKVHLHSYRSVDMYAVYATACGYPTSVKCVADKSKVTCKRCLKKLKETKTKGESK